LLTVGVVFWQIADPNCLLRYLLLFKRIWSQGLIPLFSVWRQKQRDHDTEPVHLNVDIPSSSPARI
jgi:hypothetical protein